MSGHRIKITYECDEHRTLLDGTTVLADSYVTVVPINADTRPWSLAFRDAVNEAAACLLQSVADDLNR